MIPSGLPPRSDVPEPGVSALHALYREGATAEPGLTLDRRILDAARAELRDSGATKSRRSAPWWKGWLPVTSAIAVAVVGVSVTWRAMDEQERQLREEMRAVPTRDERAGRAAPAQRPAEPQPSLNVPVPTAEKSRRADSVVVRDAPMGVPEPEAKPASVAPAVLAAPAAPAAMAPMVTEESMKKSQRAEKEYLRDRRDTSAAAEAGFSPARQMGKLEAGAPVVDAATPDAWLKDIRDLRDAGRVAEAAQSLARFRVRYPNFVLPDDLLNLK